MAEAVDDAVRVCSRCRKAKGIKAFPPSAAYSTQRRQYCTLCMREYQAERRLRLRGTKVGPLDATEKAELGILQTLARFRKAKKTKRPRPLAFASGLERSERSVLRGLYGKGDVEDREGRVYITRSGWGLYRRLRNRSQGDDR